MALSMIGDLLIVHGVVENVIDRGAGKFGRQRYPETSRE